MVDEVVFPPQRNEALLDPNTGFPILRVSEWMEAVSASGNLVTSIEAIQVSLSASINQLNGLVEENEKFAQDVIQLATIVNQNMGRMEELQKQIDELNGLFNPGLAQLALGRIRELQEEIDELRELIA